MRTHLVRAGLTLTILFAAVVAVPAAAQEYRIAFTPMPLRPGTPQAGTS